MSYPAYTIFNNSEGLFSFQLLNAKGKILLAATKFYKCKKECLLDLEKCRQRATSLRNYLRHHHLSFLVINEDGNSLAESQPSSSENELINEILEVEKIAHCNTCIDYSKI